jgi:acyl carrier protein
MTITAEQAREMVGTAVRRIVPDADLDSLAPDADLRQAFDLDSLDFLSFVELLTQQSGVRIDEEDYPELRSLSTCVDFLGSRSI